MFKREEKNREIFEAYERHIERLEKMVTHLFNALMMATKTDAGINLEKEAPEIYGPSGDPEPNPGEVFNPDEIARMP